MGDGKLIVMVSVLGVQPERHQRQASPSAWAHDEEAQLFQVGCQIIRRARQVHHNGAIALFAKTDHLVVLTNDLGSAFREVERERGLVSTQVIDVENQLLR